MRYFWPGLASPNIGWLLYVRRSLTAICVYAVYFAAAVLLSVGTIPLMVVRAVESGS
jgi:hypothetical protein